MFYIPNNRDFKYSILYHAIVHKVSVSDNYQEILLAFFQTLKRSELLRILNQFMYENNYLYTKPEVSVGFFPWRIENKIKKKLNSSFKIIKDKVNKYKNYFALKIKYFLKNIKNYF